MNITFPKCIYTLSFLAILAIPFLLLLTGVTVPKRSVFEKRNLAAKPDFHNNYRKLSQEYESYLNDNLPLRTQFIANYMRLWEMGLSSFVREHVKGIENQYFPNSKAAPTIDHYLGFHRISLRELYFFRTVIAGRQAFWKSHGASYLFMLLPDKATLYPEFLPDWVQDKHSWFDQLHSILKNTQINYLDFNKVLEKQKNPEKPFFNKIHDTYHWNGYGLDLAYKVIAKRFENNADFHQIDSKNAYTVKSKEIPAGRFFKESVPWIHLKAEKLRVRKHNYEGYKPSPWTPCDIIINDKLKNGTLVFATDSYFKQTHQNRFEGAKGNIFPLAHNVHTFIGVHYLETFSVLKKIAHVEKPDIVIEGCAEREGMSIAKRYFPRLLIAGEKLLNDKQLIVAPQMFSPASRKRNCSLISKDNTLTIVAENTDPNLFLQSQQPNKDGRLAVMVKMSSHVNTVAQIFYAQGNEKFHGERMLTKPIKKSINYLHFSVLARPGEKIRLRFDPGAKKATYTIFPMPDAKEMFEEEL